MWNDSRVVFLGSLLLSLPFAEPAVCQLMREPGETPLSSAQASPDEGFRQWTLNLGRRPRQVVARLVAMKGGWVQLEDQAGQKMAYALSKLSEPDRKAALIDRVGSGVVMVSTRDAEGDEFAFGSGFLVSSDGFLLTNYHVVLGASSIGVRFRDDVRERTATVYSLDDKHDLALLKVSSVPADAHVLGLNTKAPAQGESVWTMGHPQGLKNTVGWGGVNAVRRTGDLPEGLQNELLAPKSSRWIQTDAVISNGSSGGPLLNEDGQVVGINTFILRGGQLGFSLHIAHAEKMYLDGMQAEPIPLPLPPPDNQDPMAYLSADVAEVIESYRRENLVVAGAGQELSPEKVQRLQALLLAKYRKQLMAVAKRKPGSWTSLQALVYAGSFCQNDPSDECLTEAMNMALEHHLDQRRLMAIIAGVRKVAKQPAQDFLRRAWKESPHEQVRTIALLALTDNVLTWLEAPDSIDRERIEQTRREAEDLVITVRRESNNSESMFSSGYALQELSEFQDRLAVILLGKDAPETEGLDVYGESVDLQAHRGKAVCVFIFSERYTYSHNLFPILRQLQKASTGRPFAIVGVRTEHTPTTHFKRMCDHGVVTWPTIAAGHRAYYNWNRGEVPRIYLVDHEGRVRWVREIGLDQEQMIEHIRGLIREAKQAGG